MKFEPSYEDLWSDLNNYLNAQSVKNEVVQRTYNDLMDFIRVWIDNIPEPQPVRIEELCQGKMIRITGTVQQPDFPQEDWKYICLSFRNGSQGDIWIGQETLDACNAKLVEE